MTTIPQKTLRNDVSEVLRRVEAGERFTVTVAGRPVADLAPAGKRRWVSGDALNKVWHGPAPASLAGDLETFDASVTDPYAA